MRVVVADTGPVHNLILIEQIALLPALFDGVFLPETVRDEMLDAKAPLPVRQWIAAPPAWLHVVPDPPSLSEDILLDDLDDGERAAVQLALSMQAALLLIDDRAGVAAATRKGLVVTGTLGVLKLAALRDLVNIEDALSRLMATNFRYPPAQQRHRRHNHPGCAVSALEGRALQKRLLHAVNLRVNSPTFNGLYFRRSNFAHPREPHFPLPAQCMRRTALHRTLVWHPSNVVRREALTGGMPPGHPQCRSCFRLRLFSQRSLQAEAPLNNAIEPAPQQVR